MSLNIEKCGEQDKEQSEEWLVNRDTDFVFFSVLKVIYEGFLFAIHSSLTNVRCFNNSHVGKQPVAWKEYCAEYWLKELQQGMDKCTDRCDITEILLIIQMIM